MFIDGDDRHWLREKAANCPELQAAIDKWGIYGEDHSKDRG